MTDPHLTFDSEPHEYRIDGVLIPNVTGVIEEAGFSNFDFMDEETRAFALKRGEAVHLVTQLYDEHTLNVDKLDPQLGPFLEAWIAFRQDKQFKPTHIEHRVYHPLYLYAGTLDRMGMMGEQRALLDIKTNKAEWWTALQTAAYEACVGRTSGIPRYSVALKENGRYKLTPYRDPSDFQDFVAALRTNHLRTTKGRR